MIAGLSIEWQVGGVAAGENVLERIAVAFERTGDELKDFGTHIFPKLTPIFEAEERRQFDAEGGGPRGGWAALSPAYARWKEQNYPGQSILRRTDALYEALTESSSIFAERTIQGDTFEFGTRGVPYASFAQLGWDTPNGRVEARPPFDFSDDFESDLARAALEGARDAVEASGLSEFVEGP